LKAVSVVTIKKELQHLSSEELIQLCLRLSKFKKENKELLTYLLFEAHDESGYIETVKAEIDSQFETINTNSYFYIKKSVRKILRHIKKYARYSLKKETEAELLLYFCSKLKTLKPSIRNNTTLVNIYNRQLALIEKLVSGLHEDLQYDFGLEIDELGYI
jgi:type I site-specific restriction endonuclease